MGGVFFLIILGNIRKFESILFHKLIQLNTALIS